MDQANFPWRPLGQLLVEKGVVKAPDVEVALAEQRSTGRLLGEILVNFGYVTSWALAQALAEQHGVELQRKEGAAEAPAPAAEGEPTELMPPTAEAREWQPLGKILLGLGFLSEAELEKALAAQAEHPQRRLGEILVARGSLTGTDLAFALAEQHGLDLGPKGELDADVETVATSPAPAGPAYRVFEVKYEPTYQKGAVLYESANFLEAADFACELAGRHSPKMALAKRPLIVSPVCTRTTDGPLRPVVEEARRMEAAGEVPHAALVPVQPWIDVPDLGFAALVCADDANAAESAAGKLVDMVWQRRDEFSPDLTALDEAIRIGLASDAADPRRQASPPTPAVTSGPASATTAPGAQRGAATASISVRWPRTGVIYR